MMDSEKKKRGKNFNEGDKQRLLQVINNFSSVIENKKTDQVTVKEKLKAWDEIAEIFNSGNIESYRAANQLKCFYENYKCKLKKNIAVENIKEYSLDEHDQQQILQLTEKFKDYVSEIRLWEVIATEFNKSSKYKRTELYLKNFYINHLKELQIKINLDKKEVKETGGGPYKVLKLADSEERLLIDKIQLLPLSNPYDSSSTFFNDDPNCSIIVEESTANTATVIADDTSSKKSKTQPGPSTNVRPSLRKRKTSDAYNSIITSNLSKVNINKTKEKCIEEYNKLKLQILQEELQQKAKEHEERLKCLKIETEIKSEELKLIKLNVEAASKTNKN